MFYSIGWYGNADGMWYVLRSIYFENNLHRIWVDILWIKVNLPNIRTYVLYDREPLFYDWLPPEEEVYLPCFVVQTDLHGLARNREKRVVRVRQRTWLTPTTQQLFSIAMGCAFPDQCLPLFTCISPFGVVWWQKNNWTGSFCTTFNNDANALIQKGLLSLFQGWQQV